MNQLHLNTPVNKIKLTHEEDTLIFRNTEDQENN